MKYDEKILAGLIEDLVELRKDLRTQAGNLESAASNLSAAWEGNAGFEGFRDAKRRFDAEFGTADTADTTVDGTTIGTLNGLGKAVEAAWQNAKHIDAKVGQAFGG
ncbi:hypothetical protein OHB12_29335 [Nocardia sp. NBC_01730]|uniref:hypothetical protein n=1 Tax=Nocardia sp. NBC_01730 TaxID=2975998 RepID=UPI002E126A56|nr:hypothetical protein OHB12_29335 [Nocardia sp. NBC_01730]